MPRGGPAIDKSSRIAQQIIEEIQSGFLRPGMVVGIGEEAAAKRTASAPTLRKAIRRLIEQGHLEALPRGGRVPVPARGRSDRIVLIRRCDPRGRTCDFERPRRFHHELELQVLRMGLTLDTYGFAGDGRFHTIDGKSVDWSTVCENALGIALSLWDIREESWLLERAAVSGIPTAVWNERPRGGTLLTASNLRYFQTAYSSDSGRKLARIALSAGRSRIAWISPFQGATWAERRLEGIRDALDGRGALVCKATEPLLSVYREPEVESSDFWFDASRMRTHLGASLEPGIDEIVRKLGLLLARRTLCQRLSGLFEQALRSDADAWILANDEVAHLAWDWLQRKGKEVPGDISLAGFDDIHTSRERGLTSIHFDEGRLASACLRHLTGPREGARDEIVQIPCLAMVRRSMVA